MKSKVDWTESHWMTFAFLLPFVVMLAIHRVFNFSDALLAAPAPGERHSVGYNLTMVAMFYGGVIGFLLHTAAISSRSVRWVFMKLSFLAIGWAGGLWLIS